MTQIHRRPAGTAYPANGAQQAAQTKSFNKDLRYVQGFRQALNQGTANVSISLNSAGKFLLGVSVIPISGADITDTQVSLLINNNNVLLESAASNMNPIAVQGMLYFPTPQPLQGGKDIINLSIKKNDSGAINVMINVFYVPAM